MDITEFLTACVKDDERLALGSYPGPWVTDLDDALDENVTNESGQIVAWVRARPFTDATRSHIARHDPARVLREVAAKRKLIELHAPAVIHGEKGGADWYNRMTICRTCTPSQQFPETAWPCDTVKLLASVYADRPGYKEEWKL